MKKIIFALLITISSFVFADERVPSFDNEAVFISSKVSLPLVGLLKDRIQGNNKNVDVITVKSRKSAMEELTLLLQGVGDSALVDTVRLKKPSYIIEVALNSKNRVVVTLLNATTAEILQIWIQNKKESIYSLENKLLDSF